MNEICLTQNSQLFQILQLYLQKHGQNYQNLSITKLLELFLITNKSTYSQKENKVVSLNTIILYNSQDLVTQQNNIEKQYSLIADIKNKREKLHFDLDYKEAQLQQIINSANRIQKTPSITQKMNDLQEGIIICKERFLLLKEDKEELYKNFISLTQLNLQLKNRYQFVQNEIQNNLILFEEYKDYNQNLNNRLIKEMKITTDLDQLRTLKNKRNNLMNTINITEDTQYLINLQTIIQTKYGQKSHQENDILEIIDNILNLKKQISLINFTDNKVEQQNNQVQNQQLSIQQRFRFKTHHNLGKLEQRKLSQQEHNFKVVSQYNQGDEVKENFSNQSQYNIELISPRQPWNSKSMIIDSNKNSEKIMEFLSEKQIKSLHQQSFASISSDDSFHRLGIVTLKEELQTVYSYEQTHEYINQFQNLSDYNQNRNDIIQQIQLNIQNIEKETDKPINKNKRKIQTISLILITIGFTGWLYKRIQ